jgi:hypothetical protein
MPQKILMKRKNKCSICHSIGHNKKNCPSNSRGESSSSSRVFRGQSIPQILVPPSLDEIGDDNEDIVERMSVGTIGNDSDAGESVQEVLYEGNRWDPCNIDDVRLDDEGREIMELCEFTAAEMGGNLEELGDIHHLDLKKLFHLFWSEPMCAEMIHSTNAYGRAYVRGWKELTVIEFEAFLGIVIYLGCCSYPSRVEVWRAGIKGCAHIKRIMTKSRFDKIVRAWHYTDQTIYSAATLKGLKAADPFWPVKDFVTKLSRRCGFRVS